jgi:hypothetical protein
VSSSANNGRIAGPGVARIGQRAKGKSAMNGPTKVMRNVKEEKIMVMSNVVRGKSPVLIGYHGHCPIFAMRLTGSVWHGSGFPIGSA